MWAIGKNWQRIQPLTNITKFTFLKLIRFCTQECSIIDFKGEIFKQIKGLQMGSPLAPICSDLVLEILFDVVLQQFPSPPIFLKKYVDDVICLIKRAHIQQIHDILNSYHEDLQFTVEVESDNKINFLDMTLYRHNHRIITKWYQKEISSGRLLNFHSNHPQHQKNNIASSFISRVFELSDTSFHEENKLTITKILVENNYPKKIITKLISKYFDNRQQNDDQQNQAPVNNGDNTNQKVYSGLHFIPVLSNKIKNCIENDTSKVQFAMKPTKTERKTLFTNLKTKISKEEKADVVYKIPCNECDMVYVGQTSKKLKKRIHQHKYDLTNIATDNNKTALIHHTIDTGHRFKYDDVKILGTEKHRQKREMLEATHILLHKSVNRRTDTNNISKQFLNPIKTFGKISSLSPVKNHRQLSS